LDQSQLSGISQYFGDVGKHTLRIKIGEIMERKSLDILLKDRLEFGELSAFSKVIMDCIFVCPRKILFLAPNSRMTWNRT
jgi:hypothetical protein